jgi:hypothetical protein
MAPRIVKVEPFDLVVSGSAGARGPAASIAPIERDGRAWNEEYE